MNRTTTIPLLGVIALLMLGGCDNKPKEFKPANGEFSVMTPYTLQEKTHTENGVVIHMFEATRFSEIYTLVYVDVSVNNNATLDAMCVGSVGGMNGTIKDRKTIMLDNKYDGLELAFDGQNDTKQDISGILRGYRVGNRTYVLVVGVIRGQSITANQQLFLDSFKLLP